ncbi:hypothetical protein AB0H43_16805 [Hamadaea sp. NPDC050747]|uniref:hypothetical protein n=1 Tax=Hamadaea sp. NPDC050747 TaxID=3155789 RepID=UPI003411368E
MFDELRADRRLLIAADMESYSSRDNVLQYRAQRGFHDVMNAAARRLGLDRLQWVTQQNGDGELAILPEGTDETRIVTTLPPVVDRLLRDYNRGLAAEARVRLRIALHEGLVHLDGANGFPGEAIVTVCRLVDSSAAKRALKVFPNANVALIVSDRIYRDVVRHYHDLRPERFQRVTAQVTGKNFGEPAWIYVPDEDATKVSLDDSQPIAAPREHDAGTRPTGQRDTQATYGRITTHGPAAFGNGNIVAGHIGQVSPEWHGRGHD